jgi:phage antirepressor YoqD-like protein
MESIVPQSIGGEFRVDSRVMADSLDNKHKSLMELIGKNAELFAKFGGVPFQTETLQTRGGRQEVKYALLNEDQCYFLLTLVRNSKKVTALKAGLVMAFRAARDAAATAHPALDMSDPLAVAQAFVTAEKERRALALKVEDLAPRAEGYDTFMDSAGLLSMHTAAQLLNIGEKTLFARLRDERVLMDGDRAGRDLHNTPYRRYHEQKYFEVKTRTVSLPHGREIQQSTTYVTPKGMEFLRRLFGVKPSHRPLPLLAVAL